MEYKIIQSDDVEIFNTRVEHFLKLGFKLYGNPFATLEKRYHTHLTNDVSLYNQAVIKE